MRLIQREEACACVLNNMEIRRRERRQRRRRTTEIRRKFERSACTISSHTIFEFWHILVPWFHVCESERDWGCVRVCHSPMYSKLALLHIFFFFCSLYFAAVAVATAAACTQNACFDTFIFAFFHFFIFVSIIFFADCWCPSYKNQLEFGIEKCERKLKTICGQLKISKKKEKKIELPKRRDGECEWQSALREHTQNTQTQWNQITKKKAPT